MSFDSLNISHKEQHEIQPALKHIVQHIVQEFEQDTALWGKLEYAGPLSERFVDMDVNTLIQLHMSIGGLGTQIDRIKKQFVLDENQKKILEDLKTETDAVIHSEQEIELIKKWEESNQDDTVTVDADLANALSNHIHILEEGMKNLKEIFT